jgi:hypothetical protein
VQQQGIALSAYGPQTPVTKCPGGPIDAVLAKLTKKYAVNAGEILLRWCIEQDVVAVTTSSKEQRLSDYLRAMTFKLTPAEVKMVSSHSFFFCSRSVTDVCVFFLLLPDQRGWLGEAFPCVLDAQVCRGRQEVERLGNASTHSLVKSGGASVRLVDVQHSYRSIPPDFQRVTEHRPENGRCVHLSLCLTTCLLCSQYLCVDGEAVGGKLQSS